MTELVNYVASPLRYAHHREGSFCQNRIYQGVVGMTVTKRMRVFHLDRKHRRQGRIANDEIDLSPIHRAKIFPKGRIDVLDWNQVSQSYLHKNHVIREEGSQNLVKRAFGGRK